LDDCFDLLTLALLPGNGPKALRALKPLGPLRKLLSRPDALTGVVSERALAGLRSGEARRAAEGEMRRARDLGIRLVGLDHGDYPAPLREIYDPPLVLYVRGDLAGSAARPAVAVVGARRASARGLELTRALARDLAAAGVVIVSGLARGIDTAAHRGALEGGGRTLAVQGRGLDAVYPPDNTPLARKIEESGALISEFAIGTTPVPENFPKRNRIIAGLSDAVVVVEAEARSGSLITARIALDEGRDVLAVPGHPNDPLAQGTNQLLRDGAALVRDASDVAAEIGVELPELAPEAAEADDVLRALPRDVPVSLEELEALCGRALPELLARLTELELSSRIRRLPGPLFVRAGTSV
jgi:DNA processing protein